MKRVLPIILVTVLLTCMYLLILLVGCSHPNTERGPFTQKNDAFDNAVPINIDDTVIQACYDYIDKNGYGNSGDTHDKYTYKSVCIGKTNMSAVVLDDESMRDMLDESDYVIVFDFINIVVDSDTHTILGRIPLV